MPGSSHRKQLMYDLTARIVDAEEIPINFVIVSNWARTGWNVIKPNLLIDATATRDVTAWQQLVGRAIRASRSWTNDCYRLLTILTGHYAIPGDGAMSALETDSDNSEGLDPDLHKLILEVVPENLRPLVVDGTLNNLTDDQRNHLVLALAQKRNKVTHIYALIKAYGSEIQLEYNRLTKAWQRKEVIAAKHAQEVSPHPFSGQRLAGDAHAPFIYVEDPRSDLPESLQQRLEAVLPSADNTIIMGWLDEAPIDKG